jgi:L-lactate dehydrogenase complex protein LldG
VSARDRILARLRAATRDAAAARPDLGAWARARREADDPGTRVARLRAALTASRAEVHDVTADSWPGTLLSIAEREGVRRLLIGADTPHGELLAARSGGALQLRRYDGPVEGWREDLFDGIDAALTLARSAIADTGTLVLWPDAREPRLMSLVPPVHFVLLDAADILPDLLSTMQAQDWGAGLPANVVLISGPSKTADIQQTLAYGAHGPRALIVLLRHPDGAVP